MEYSGGKVSKQMAGVTLRVPDTDGFKEKTKKQQQQKQQQQP
jgi:hypothetical protein